MEEKPWRETELTELRLEQPAPRGRGGAWEGDSSKGFMFNGQFVLHEHLLVEMPEMCTADQACDLQGLQEAGPGLRGRRAVHLRRLPAAPGLQTPVRPPPVLPLCQPGLLPPQYFRGHLVPHLFQSQHFLIRPYMHIPVFMKPFPLVDFEWACVAGWGLDVIEG
jgi:hypothetical protein